ncbi:MAG TPA: NAD-dependent epimerase/dehydratase family protein, partial [Gammaproteobacteria bacterium]|nr:NAD-dependent epimerase/dehydratase family protein [Gammaproteobacteria bacterium]
MSKNRLLITGGAGFIGSTIAKAALKQDFDVTILDLPNMCENVTGVHAIGCDILDYPNLEKSLKHMDYVIHAAANPSLWSTNFSHLYQTNYIGTLNVIKACSIHRVKRLVHISSDCTLLSKKNPIVNEISKTSFQDMPGIYAQSKWKAEQAILYKSSIPTLVINPGIPLGATSQNTPFIALIQSFLTNKYYGYIHGNLGVIDVEDIALCALQALTLGKVGHRYLAVSEVWSIRTLLEKLQLLSHTQSHLFKIPRSLAFLIASFAEIYALWSKKA